MADAREVAAAAKKAVEEKLSDVSLRSDRLGVERSTVVCVKVFRAGGRVVSGEN